MRVATALTRKSRHYGFTFPQRISAARLALRALALAFFGERDIPPFSPRQDKHGKTLKWRGHILNLGFGMGAVYASLTRWASEHTLPS